VCSSDLSWLSEAEACINSFRIAIVLYTDADPNQILEKLVKQFFSKFDCSPLAFQSLC